MLIEKVLRDLRALCDLRVTPRLTQQKPLIEGHAPPNFGARSPFSSKGRLEELLGLCFRDEHLPAFPAFGA